jgi:hypothetical protein
VKTLLVIVVLVACRLDVDPAGRGEPRDSRPRFAPIRSEPIPQTGPLDFDRTRLPPGARGKFPSFDGDSFSITIAPPEQARTPEETFESVVAPLMRAMGYGSRVQSMSIPDAGSVFQQMESGSPIESAAVIVGPNSVHGTLFHRYGVTNAVTLAASAALSAQRGLTAVESPELVLLPYGATRDGRIALRYAYRILLAEEDARSRTWLGWVDAESGGMLQLVPQFDVE